MIIASNHLQSIGMPLPEEVIVRVNLAWFPTVADAEFVLLPLSQPVYLDFPQGRTKPPKPTITLDEAIALANKHKVKYFAVSNVESALTILGIKSLLHEGVEIVPKIETKTGILRMNDIARKTGVKTMMFDKEDLYVDVEKEIGTYNMLVDKARKNAKEVGVHLLELQGVIFA